MSNLRYFFSLHLLLFVITNNCSEAASSSLNLLKLRTSPGGYGINIDLNEISYLKREKYDEFKKLIIDKPVEFVNLSKKFNKELFSNSKSKEVDDETALYEDDGNCDEFLKDQFEKIKEDFPLCLISECTASDCPLNRLVNKDRRTEFEDKVTNYIINNFDKNKRINYTDFAGSTAFSTIRILTHLIGLGFTKFNLNLIDYKHLLIYDNNLLNSPQALSAIQSYVQLIQWLKFEQSASININLFSDVNKYIKECINNEESKSDIIFAIDFYEDNYMSFVDLITLQLCLKKDGFTSFLKGQIGTNKFDASYIKSV